MPELPTEEDRALWDQYIGPNGVPRIVVTPITKQSLPSEPIEFDDDAFIRAAERLRRSAKRIPVYGPPAPDKPPSYLIEPDLMEAQQGQAHLPTGIAINEAGIPYNIKTGVEIPTVPRPNVLPVASTPEGLKFAMPKMLDIVGNVMSPLAAPAVATKAGEVVLGSGAVKKALEASKINETTGPFYSSLERAVDNAKLGKADAQQWLGYLKNQPGVKSEELNYVLGDLKGQLTKEQVQDIVKNNKVSLEEKVLGSEKDRIKELDDAAQDRFGYDFDDLSSEQQGQILNDNPYLSGLTKYDQWQLPGGENYQELLFKLPDRTKKYKLEDIENLTDTPAYAKANKNYWYLKTPDNEFSISKKEFPTLEDAMNRIVRDKRPNLAELDNFKSSHFDDDGTNLLAHVRMNDRYLPDYNKINSAEEALTTFGKELKTKYNLVNLTPYEYGKLNKQDYNKLQELLKEKDQAIKGSKTLHIEEIQSDWHQKGRKEGYIQKDLPELKQKAEAVDEKLIAANAEDIMANPDLKEGLNQAVERKIITQKEADDYLRLAENEHSTVPDAPFKKNWDELALKRMLHKAATEGYEGISWTPGEAQAARYDLSKSLNKIEYNKEQKSLFAFDKTGKQVLDERGIDPDKLVDFIGKEASKKLLETELSGKYKNTHKLEGLDLKIGGEGMKAFYDEMLVSKANALAKKYGAKVESRNINKTENKNYRIGQNEPEGFETARGQEYRKKYPFAIYFENPQGDTRFLAAYENKKLAEEALDKLNKDKQPIHYLPITPELRAKAKEGFPLFSSTPILNPVDFNPFEKQDKKYKLTPVQYDPFA